MKASFAFTGVGGYCETSRHSWDKSLEPSRRGAAREKRLEAGVQSVRVRCVKTWAENKESSRCTNINYHRNICSKYKNFWNILFRNMLKRQSRKPSETWTAWRARRVRRARSQFQSCTSCRSGKMLNDEYYFLGFTCKDRRRYNWERAQKYYM